MEQDAAVHPTRSTPFRLNLLHQAHVFFGELIPSHPLPDGSAHPPSQALRGPLDGGLQEPDSLDDHLPLSFSHLPLLSDQAQHRQLHGERLVDSPVVAAELGKILSVDGLLIITVTHCMVNQYADDVADILLVRLDYLHLRG